MTLYDLYAAIDRAAPFSLQEPYDNAGLLVGDGGAPVQRAVVALDITPEVILQAQNENAQAIVSHHPVIFHPVRSLCPQDPVYMLARAGIGAVCAHTNLDRAKCVGVNDCLAAALHLQQVFTPQCGDQADFLRVGSLPAPMQAQQLAEYIKEKLGGAGVSYLPVQGDIAVLAVCGGAGADLWQQAKAAGAQALLTGEAKHHEYLAALQAGFGLFAAGHYATEAVVVPVLTRYLQQALPQVRFIAARGGQEPYRCL